MDKFSELKAAAMAATPGRIGDRIDGSGSIKYECTGYDGSLVLRTDHKDMEYGFVGDNADADELFFRLCVPDVVLTLLAGSEAKDERIGELEAIATEYAGKFQKAQDALKYAAIMSDEDKKKIAELEAKLATPVRLPTEHELHQVSCSECAGNCLELVERTVRAAGFKVEGGE